MKDNLKYLRKQKGWTQGEVASRLKLKGHSTYSNWEYGRTEPDHESIKKIAQLYNVTTDYLLGRSVHIALDDLLVTLQTNKLTWNGEELSDKERKKLIKIMRTVLE